MDLLVAQLLTLSSLFAAMLVLFLLPFWLVNRKPGAFHGRGYRLGFGLANCLSAGVFLATFFVGLLPEVGHAFRALWPEAVFPLTETVVFAGFFVALLAEQCALVFKERKKSDEALEPPVKVKIGSSSSSSGQEDEEDRADGLRHSHGGHSHGGHSHGGGGHGHSHAAEWSQLASNDGGFRIFILLFALGVHSIFEGLALGLQRNPNVLYSLFVGVAVHECLVAFAVGVSVARNKLSTKATIKLALLFSASIPVGQVLGIIVGNSGGQSRGAQIANATLQGLAAGTFIHVTFLEVIPSEFREDSEDSVICKFLKLVFLLLGFLLLLACSVALAHAMGPHGH